MDELFEKIDRKVDRMKPVYDTVYKIILTVCRILLIGEVLITCLAVLGRYVPFIPDPSWSEEVVLTLMAYMALLSASLALRRGTHIRMLAFDDRLPEKLRLVSDLIADAAVLVFGYAMLKVGLKYSIAIGLKASYTSLPWLSKFWMYFPVPAAGLAMVFFELEAVYTHLKAFCMFKKREGEARK